MEPRRKQNPPEVDLDGTLASTDTLFRQFAVILFRQINDLPRAFAALLYGRFSFKAHHADRVSLAVDTLNYHKGLIAHLRKTKLEGGRTMLCPTADQRFAEAVASHLAPVSTKSIASQDGTNLQCPSLSDKPPVGLVEPRPLSSGRQSDRVCPRVDPAPGLATSIRHARRTLFDATIDAC